MFSIQSILIALTLWYVLVLAFSAGFLFATKRFKEVGAKKVFLYSLAITVVYFVVNAISIAFFSSSLLVLGIANVAMLYGLGTLSAKYAWNETDKPIVFSIFFALFLNLLWYKLLGII